MKQYVSVDAMYPYKMRGTNQQTQTGLLWVPPSYKAWPRGAGSPSPTTIYGPGMALGTFSLHNRSGGAIVVAIGVRIPNYLWKAGQWTDATTTYTDDTTAAQDTTTDDFALETTTNNDGYVILSRVKFNAVSINVSTASVDGTPVRATRFSDAAGSAWQTAESQVFVPATTGGQYATGEEVVAFSPPVDWGKSSSLATDLPNGFYAMNVRATTAPTTTAGLAKAIEIFRLYYITEAVADNGALEPPFSTGELIMAQDETEGVIGDALVALFGTANDGNRVTCQVRAL